MRKLPDSVAGSGGPGWVPRGSPRLPAPLKGSGRLVGEAGGGMRGDHVTTRVLGSGRSRGD
jgi:hypothetical protein